LSPGTVSIAFSVVEKGHCTSWLAELCQQASQGVETPDLAAFMKRTTTFTLPADERKPVIMVGASKQP